MGRIGPISLILLALGVSAWGQPWGPRPTFRGASAEDVVGALETEDRAKAAFLLGQIGDRKVVPALAEFTGDPDRSVRVQAGIALASLGDRRGIPVCATALNSDPTWIRCYAAYALWQVDTPRARRILKESLKGQGKFISEVINGALSTPYVTPAKSAAKKLSLDDPGDALAEEADWWWHEGNLEQAARCLETMLFLDPTDVQTCELAAWLEWSLGRDDQAVNTLKRGIAEAPDNPEAYFQLGFHYFNTKRYILAREPLRKALDLGGDDIMRRQYAHCLEKLGQYSEALDQWTILLQKAPDDSVVKMNYGRVKRLVNGEQ